MHFSANLIKLKTYRFILFSVMLCLAALFSACELFPYGIYGDKGAVSLRIFDETGQDATVTKAYGRVYKENDDHSSGDSAMLQYPPGADYLELDLVGIDPGEWRLRVEVYKDGEDQPSCEIYDMDIHVYESVTLSYDIGIKYNRGEDLLAMNINETTVGLPEKCADKADFMGYRDPNTSGLGFGVSIRKNMGSFTNGELTVVTDDGFDPVVSSVIPFSLTDPAASADIQAAIVNSSELVLSKLNGFSTATCMSYPFEIKLFDGNGDVKLYSMEIPDFKNDADIPAITYTTEGTRLNFSFHYSFDPDSEYPCEYCVGIIIGAGGAVEAESRTSKSPNLKINTAFIDDASMGSSLTYYLIFYYPEDYKQIESGIAGTFLDMTDFDSRVSPAEHAYVRLRNIYVHQGSFVLN